MTLIPAQTLLPGELLPGANIVLVGHTRPGSIAGAAAAGSIATGAAGHVSGAAAGHVTPWT